MPPDIDLDEVFTFELNRRVYKDNTFTLNGFLFEVPCVLAGKNIKIRFSPFIENPPIKVYYDTTYYGVAHLVDTYANTKIKRNVDTKQYAFTDSYHEGGYISASLPACGRQVSFKNHNRKKGVIHGKRNARLF
jgi:hypothetical protein